MRLAAIDDTEKTESVSHRIQRLIAEARRTANDAAVVALEDAANLCAQLAELATFEVLPEGERDAYKKLAAEIDSRCTSIAAIRSRR